MAGSSKMLMMMMLMVAPMLMQTSMAQTRHVVGGALGWTIPTGAAYPTWVSQQTFNVGDTLFFNFTTGFHDVAEVTQAAYGPCTTNNPISLTTTGPATLTLSTAGPHYYICTFGTHCQIGQKLAINVSGGATAPTAPPTATPPPTPTPVSPPAPTPVSPPAPTPVSPPAPTPVSPPAPTPVSPPATSPSPTPAPSTTTPSPASSPAPSTTGASPPAPPTSGTSPPTQPPASDTTPTPPSPSTAARSFTSVVPATFLAVAFAFFY